MDAFHVAEKSNKHLKAKLAKEEKERKFVVAALNNVEKQAESQRLLLRDVENQLAASKEQIATLKKKLEEVERAKDQVEKAKEEAQQEGYDIGVLETEEAFKAEFLGVCRIYCAQVWDEALNQVRVEASSMLRKAKNVYYPPAIRASSLSSSMTDAPPEVADAEKYSPSKVPPPPGSPSTMAEKPKADEKGAKMTKKVALNVIVPLAAPQDPSKDKEDTMMEIVLASFPILAKGDSKE